MSFVHLGTGRPYMDSKVECDDILALESLRSLPAPNQDRPFASPIVDAPIAVAISYPPVCRPG